MSPSCVPATQKRLSIGALHICAFVFWLSCALFLTLFRNLDHELTAGIAFVCAVVGLVLLLAITRIKHGEFVLRIIYALSAALIAGGFAGWAASAVLTYQLPDARESDWLDYKLEEDLIAREDEYRVKASFVDGQGQTRFVELTFYEDPGLLLFGDVIRSSAVLKAADVRDDFNWDKKIVCRADVYSYEVIEPLSLLGKVYDLRRHAVEAFEVHGGNQAGILQALICGYRGGIEESGEYEDYKIVGLAHVIAVSGSHLAIVAAFVQMALMRLGIPPSSRCAITMTVMGAYFIFTGCSISAMRSLFMVVAVLCSYYSARRGSALNALSACVFGFIAIDPFAALSVSFALSAGSTLGIILFAELLIKAVPLRNGILKAALLEPVALTVASGLTTQLYSSALFSQMPTLSLLANILIAPLFLVSCVTGLIAALFSVVLPSFCQIPISLAALTCVPMQLTVSTLASVPLASLSVSADPAAMLFVSAVASIALYLWWPTPKQLAQASAVAVAASLVVLCAFSVNLASKDELIMLDVGQGDSFVVRSRGVNLMVDTGNQEAKLRQALGRNYVYHLDAVLITHPDDDHCGSLTELSRYARIDRVMVHEGVTTCPCDNCTGLMHEISLLRGSPELVLLRYGDDVQVGNIGCSVVWPSGFRNSGGNADSLSLHLVHDKFGWEGLLVGDAEAQEVIQMVRVDQISDIDFFKVGHHGSSNAVNEEVAEMISPQISLLSVGKNNLYGHPNAEVMSLLESQQSEIFRTDVHGDVALMFEEDEIQVRY